MDNSNEIETESIHESHETEDVLSTFTIRTYKRRFWILFLVSFLSFFQCVQWNTWGPISASAIEIFPGWQSSTVALLGNFGVIAFVIFVIPACYYVKHYGLRSGVLTCACLVVIGTVLRCSTTVEPYFTLLCNLCAILVGAAGTVLQAAPSLLAADWFPPNERTTAVALLQAFNQLGNAGSYLEPLVIPAPSDASIELITYRIQLLLCFGALIASFLFLAIIIYFPSKPPTPPSITSSVKRYEFMQSMKLMLRDKQMLMVFISYSLYLGVPSSWMAVLNFSLSSLGIKQNEAMKIALIAVITSCIVVILIGRVTDRFFGYLKITIMALIGLSFATFVWFLLLSLKVLPFSLWQVYVSVILSVSSYFASSPLYFELAVEVAYPSPEEVVGGILVGGRSIIGAIFLLLFFIPTQDYVWVTYCLLAGCGLSLLPLIFFREEYVRSSIDRRDKSLASSFSQESLLLPDES